MNELEIKLCDNTKILNVKILLMKINNNKEKGNRYIFKLLEMKNEIDFVKSIITNSLEIVQGKTIRDYDNEFLSNSIYKISINNFLLSEQYKILLNDMIKDIDDEVAEKFNKGYIVKFQKDDNNFMFISLSNTNKTYENNYSLKDGNMLIETPAKQIVLKQIFDIIIIDDIVYAFNDKIETLFAMEKSYIKHCEKTFETINYSSFIDNVEYFKSIMLKPINAKRMLKINIDTCNELNINEKVRKDICIQNTLKYNSELKKIILNDDEEACVRLCKILCDKIMLHPINKKNYEVSNATPA